MHAFLIIGKTETDREAYISAILQSKNILQYDQTIIDETETITIAQIRSCIQEVQLKPIGQIRAVLIKRAHLMTIQAQNALLKLLEEPPIHTQLYLEAPTSESLLATIISRCSVTALGTSSKPELHDQIQTALTLPMSYGERIAYVDSVSQTSADALTWIGQALVVLHASLLKSPTHKTARAIRLILKGKKQLDLHVNPKLVLDTILSQIA